MSAEYNYAWWRASAENLLEPLAALMRPGKADLPLEGQASNHGAQADRVESFARPCLLAAHWLASEPGASEKLSREKIAEWFRRGLVIGTDPSSGEYWGPTANHHQHTVEMAALTLALQIARQQLWSPLTKAEQSQIASWPNMLGQISTAMAKAGLNIHNMVNKSRGDMAYTLVDVDSTLEAQALAEIAAIDGVLSVRYLPMRD